MQKKISYGKNVYGRKEISAVIKTLNRSTQMGKSVEIFENKIAKLFSKKYGLMVNSGSSALILALKVMNFPKGSEIIAPCLNFGTAVSSIMLSNLNPIFVDCDIETLQIDTDKIEPNINGLFQFKYLDDGKYIAVAVEEKIDSLSYDFRNKRYGFINSNFIDLINNESINITIRIDDPLERLLIKSFRVSISSFNF